MQAGRLNRRCVIQQPGPGVDEIGQPLPDDWVDLATVWGDIRMKSGLEAIKAGAPVSTVQASIRIRYRSEVTAGMRVVHNLVNYDIKAVMPDASGREFVDLACERST